MDKRYSKIESDLKMKKNIFYAQSGGVTPVINATAAAVALITGVTPPD